MKWLFTTRCGTTSGHLTALAAAGLAGMALAAAPSGEGSAPGDPARLLSRSFEFRAVRADAKADGETDFKGETAVMSTEERVAFLRAYADHAAKWFGDPGLDQLAVKAGEAGERLAQIKPRPLPLVRQTIRLDGGWKRMGFSPNAPKELTSPWRSRPGVEMKDGELILPAGATEILDLAKSNGWRYELRWEARAERPGQSVQWLFGAVGAPAAAGLVQPKWQSYRLQADLAQKSAYLSRDGERVAGFRLEHPTGQPVPFFIRSEAPVGLRNLVFIDYRTQDNVEQPYVPVVLADDDFRVKPSTMEGWNQASCDDRAWLPASLPCVHGGFREAGEDLYLRRTIELPATSRVWLEIEALDPSGEIYINGKLAAAIPNRLPVLLDISPLVNCGSNVIALKVNHNWIEDPMHHSPADQATGWFAGRTALHLVPGVVAIRELLVHTASLDESRNARQVHQFRLENPAGDPFSGALEIAYNPWYPQEGPALCVRTVPVRLETPGSHLVTIEMDLPGASLWTPEQPQLYCVRATLRDGAGHAVDDLAQTTGVRTVAQKDGQLLLNGRPALLIGAQNMGLRPFPDTENGVKFNRCAPDRVLMSELLAVKNMGGNLFRVHVHSALNKTGGINDPRIAEMADQLGMALFWTGPAWIREGDERSIDTVHAGDYIRQVYNHPSILNWELSNHPNTFKKEESIERTHEFVRKTVQAVLAVDSSRLITPTTFWTHCHYGNDLGTLDWKKRPVTSVPEYTHPLVTRGTQDAVTGYGAEWTALRKWPRGFVADCLGNRVRAWFNFEHEESAAQPNWELSAGWPWHRVRSYEAGYEKGSIGRILAFEEWRASQGWQAFSAYESMRKQIWHGVAGFSWCTIEGGANSGTYEKPLLDPLGHAKLAWHIHKMLAQPVLAGSDNADTVYGPRDTITPGIFHVGPARTIDLAVSVKTPEGQEIDRLTFPGVRLEGGRTLVKLPAFRPKLPVEGYCVVEYTVTAHE